MSDQPKIEITLDGAPCTIEAGSTGALLLQDAVKKDGVVAMRVNGEPWDLERQIPAGAVVAGVPARVIKQATDVAEGKIALVDALRSL